MAKHRIAVIAGDGIGKEVMPEGLRVLDEAARKFGIDLHFDHFDFSSWDYYEKHGKMLPDNWKDQIGGHEAIYFGAVGWPEKIADHVSLWGSLLLFRREFDQYINLRPARLMPGVIAPVVRRDGSTLDADSLKRHALANGPAYQHPRRIRFVDELPWAGTNKIDRNALLLQARALEARQTWTTPETEAA